MKNGLPFISCQDRNKYREVIGMDMMTACGSVNERI